MDSKFPELKKMSKAGLLEEVKTWRNIWGWIPSPIKYYISRTGNTIGLQVRNYHRFLGVLLETTWELKFIEIGVYEKVYDQNDGQYYFERKIVKIPIGQIVAFDWIAERTAETELLKEGEESAFEDGMLERPPGEEDELEEDEETEEPEKAPDWRYKG